MDSLPFIERDDAYPVFELDRGVGSWLSVGSRNLILIDVDPSIAIDVLRAVDGPRAVTSHSGQSLGVIRLEAQENELRGRNRTWGRVPELAKSS